MSVLQALVAAQGQADERLMRSADYAANAWGGMMESRVFKAAGQDLINLIESTPPDKDITALDVMKIAQKWKLSEGSMQKLMDQIKDSGALDFAQKQRRFAMEEMRRKDALAGQVKEQTGLDLPSDVAGDVVKESLKPKAPTKLQEAGLTEKGNNVVGYNPETNELTVNDGGMQRPYDPSKDGRVMSKNLSQGVVIKLQQEKQMATDVTTSALDLAAQQYLQTGKMPALGMGNANLRMKVLNRAGEIVAGLGVDPSKVPALQAGFNAEQQALKTLTNATANFGAFEQGMIKNADYAESLSKKFPRSKLPPVNLVVNAIKKGTGDPAIVRFSNALYAAALEYEKIRTAGTNVSSAELSIGAQKKAEELINTAQNHEQLQAAFEAMKVDAKNIMDARKGEISDLKAGLSSWGKQESGGRGIKVDPSEVKILE